MISDIKSQNKSITNLRRLLISTLFLGLTVVILGAYTRLTHSGLGCPDWPGCYGHFAVPSADKVANIYPEYPMDASKAWIEMIHRYFASTLGLVLVSLAFFYRKNPFAPRALLWTLSLLVIFQGTLGAWTVTWRLHPTVVMAHLLGGMTIVSLIWVSLLKTGTFNKPNNFISSKKTLSLGLGAIILLVLQIALGGWTSSNYAAMVCPDFPYCQGKLIPELDFSSAFNLAHPIGPDYEGGILENTPRITIHMTHRIGAIIVTLYLLCFCLWSFFKRGQKSITKYLSITVLGLLSLQIALGILNIHLYLPLKIAVSHNAVALLLLLSLIALVISNSNSLHQNRHINNSNNYG